MTTARHTRTSPPLRPGPIPLYYQLERHLADRIAAGEFAPRKLLPSEEHLCAEYGVSRITVRRALEALHQDRVIARRRGVGTFVADSGDSGRSVELVGSLDDVLSYPTDVSYRVLGRRTVDAPAAIAEGLEFGAPGPVVRMEIVHYSSSQPFAHSELFLPEAVGALIRRSDITDGLPVLQLLERKLGERVSRAQQTVEAAIADPLVARHLGVDAGTPLLRVLRTYYTEADRPVEVAVVRYHPRYRYSVQLFARSRRF